jgi:Ca2+-binding EF-hand superfamily protein
MIQTDHFSLVFDELDRNHSGKISKRDLEFYNKETGLNLTKNDIEMMINIASRDGERVGK